MQPRRNRLGPQTTNGGQAGPDWPPAVIAGGYRTGVLGMRSLVRRGVRTACVESQNHPEFPAFRTRYGPGHGCPDPDGDPGGWVDFMVALSQKTGGRPVLIASADQFVSAIARHAAKLAAHYVLSPGVPLQGLLADKRTQYELAAAHGMPMPRTALVNAADDVERFADVAAFPCLLKPLHFREWQVFPHRHPLSYEKVAIATTPDALVRCWRLASAASPTCIVQEIIEGPDTAKRVYVGCYDADSRRIAHAMFRELRCDPLGFGPATVSEPVTDVETDAICDRFLRSVGYSGICEIEMKRDSRDGRLKLIEANPRLTGGGDAAPYDGVDVCWVHYLDLIGKLVTPVGPAGNDFRHIVLRGDVRAVMAYRKAGLLGWRDLLRSYRPPLAFYDFDRHDWRYSLETVYRMARSGAAPWLRSVAGALSSVAPSHHRADV